MMRPVHMWTLEQHCDSVIHKAGNTLDFVKMETFSGLQIKACQAGDFISNHSIVQSWVSITKNAIQHKSIAYRKLADINIEGLVEDMRLEDLAEINDVNVLAKLCDERMRKSLDTHAPIQTKSIMIRQTNPWFTEKVRSLKKAVRRREKLWHKYKTEDTWLTYMITKLTYRKVPKEAKTEAISGKVLECNWDSKKFYSLFNSLSSTSKENPLPTIYDSDEETANAFVDYFMDKIKGIQDSLEHHWIYQPAN